MAGMGWYGPLIDLSRASSHVGDYVQLLVFVHKSTPIQVSPLFKSLIFFCFTSCKDSMVTLFILPPVFELSNPAIELNDTAACKS